MSARRQEGLLRQEGLPLVSGLRSLVCLVFSSWSVAVKHPEIPLFLNNGELAALFSICDPAGLVISEPEAVSRRVTEFIQSSTFDLTNVSVSCGTSSFAVFVLRLGNVQPLLRKRTPENSEKMELKRTDSCVQHGGVKTLCAFSGWRPFNEKNLISFMNGRKRF